MPTLIKRNAFKKRKGYLYFIRDGNLFEFKRGKKAKLVKKNIITQKKDKFHYLDQNGHLIETKRGK